MNRCSSGHCVGQLLTTCPGGKPRAFSMKATLKSRKQSTVGGPVEVTDHRSRIIDRFKRNRQATGS
jgi:hypothetical protein